MFIKKQLIYSDVTIMEPFEKELTDKIIGACMEVSNTLGIGFLENVYHRALLIELDKLDISYISQAHLEVNYKGQIIGNYTADILVESEVILELKAIKQIKEEMLAQLMNYMRASNVKIGYLINFGNSRVEWKRIVI